MRASRILIVDDREINRYLRGQVLRKAGYEISEAASGEECLYRSTNENPDLVLLDVHLPGLGGLEVCRRLKKSAETASIMVIQISASAINVRDALAGLEGGADDYLVEPVEPELLVAKVRSLLRLREVEENLRRSNNDLQQFASVVSHDLQAPLRAVTTFAQLLERHYASQFDERAQTYIEHIVSGSQRMSALIRDLLEYSSISSNPGEDTGPVDVSQVVRQTRDLLHERLQDARGSITTDPLPVIQGNELRVGQVMRNLIENAIKYRRGDVPLHIHVGVQLQGRHWVFSVRDNGQGFEPEYAEQIFAIFRRLHGQEVLGTGIGLAICRTVVERAGGKIWAEGRPGEGATFYFTWPYAAEAAHA